MKKRYKQLLTYVKDAVTRNKSEKSINSILDYISTSQQVRKPAGGKTDCLLHGVSWTLELVNRMQTSIYSTCVYTPLQADLLQWFYETTLDALQDAKNDRLWFKTNTKVDSSFPLLHINFATR